MMGMKLLQLNKQRAPDPWEGGSSLIINPLRPHLSPGLDTACAGGRSTRPSNMEDVSLSCAADGGGVGGAVNGALPAGWAPAVLCALRLGALVFT